MSEDWRRKKYYSTRVLIGTEDVLDSPFPDALLCLSGGQLNILRNLLQYAHRRANFVTEYEALTYLTPTNEEWDSIQALVADLEDQAMSDCTDLMDKLDDILAAVTCICPALSRAGVESVIDPVTMDTEEVQDVFDYSDNLPNGTASSEEAEAACAMAQLWYQAGYEIITEDVMPATRFAFDVLIPAVAAAIAVMTGGATLPAFLGAYAVAELIQELLELGYDAAESNLQNWLWSVKEEMVCEMYSQLKVGGGVTAMWAAVYDEVVAETESISYGDKLMVNLFMSGLSYFVAKAAATAETDWADENVTEGYCDECPLEPVIGNDWWAMPLLASENTMTLYKAPDTWTHGTDCWEYPVPAGQRLVGYVLKKTAGGTWPWKRMSNYDAGCTGGCQMTPNTSENWTGAVDTEWFVADEGYIDEANCKAALSPGATTMTDLGTCLGAVDGRQGLMDNGGFGDTFTIELVALFAIFDGTSPPE